MLLSEGDNQPDVVVAQIAVEVVAFVESPAMPFEDFLERTQVQALRIGNDPVEVEDDRRNTRVGSSGHPPIIPQRHRLANGGRRRRGLVSPLA